MKFKTALAAVAAMTLTGTAYAQVGPEVGATVYEAPNGEIGGVIGTIETIENDTVLVDVDGMDAPLPLAAFGEGPDGPVIAATKAQIVQMLQQLDTYQPITLGFNRIGNYISKFYLIAAVNTECL